MAIINVDDAYILNETGAQVDKTTGIPFKNESLTEAEAAQARANIRAGGTNTNLLDNPWFIKPVNQKGISGAFTTASGDFLDRWRNNNANGVVVNSGYLTAKNGGGFRQFTEVDRIVKGEYTFSVMTTDGSVASTTGTLDPAGTVNDWQISSNNFSPDMWVGIRLLTATVWDIDMTFGADKDIVALKLEKGTVSTLQNDTPPNFALEQEKCKLYFERIKSANGAWTIFGQGIADQSNRVMVLVPMSPKRNGDYTVSTSGSFRLQGSSNITPTSLAKASAQPSSGMLELQANASVTQGNVYYLGANNDANAYIDIVNGLV